MFKIIAARLRSWWNRNIIADAPTPDLSFLDRMDGLSPVEYFIAETGTVNA